MIWRAVRNLWRRWYYDTQHGPRIYSRMAQALAETPQSVCPFCDLSGQHETGCYLVKRAER